MNFSSKSDLAKPGRKVAFNQIVTSIVIVIICTVITYFIWDLSSAKSALVGGLIAIIPNLVFAIKAFQYAGASAAKKVVESFYSGVRIKLVLTAILFSLSFKFLQLALLPFFITYFLILLVPFVQAVMNSFSFNQR